MISCKLGEKTYTVDFITGRALREMGEASDMYAKIARIGAAAANGEEVDENENNVTVADALDCMVQWFCLIFKNQFTPDEVYDNYPSDRLLHDMAYALIAVQNQTTSILDTFPTKAAETPRKNKKG